uniref:HECT domain-containing protein n=1 Tax=Anguilla anguilla TaxID=7936 RepID=A0A0E9VDF9_ANGAN
MRFVSGRSRLPANSADISQRFQIMKVDRPYDSLPTSQTCFFQLRLPPYSNQPIMAERLRYAINNCRSIDIGQLHALPQRGQRRGLRHGLLKKHSKDT